MKTFDGTRWNQNTNEVIKVEDYGATGDGVTDDSSAIRSAIADVPDGSTIKFSPNKTYRLANNFHNSGKSLKFEAYGATILLDSSNARIGAGNSTAYKDILAVSSLTEVTAKNSPHGADNITNTVATITGEVPSTWRRGDLIRVVADDVIPGSKDEGSTNTSQGRVGQTLTFISSSGNEVTLAGKLDDPYTTNIKIARLDTSVKFSWYGGTIEISDDTFQNSSTSYLIEITYVSDVVIKDVSIPRITRGAISLRECRNWLVDNVDFGYGINDLSLPAFGYGLANFASYYGTLSNCTFRDLRHGYTNGHNGTAAGRTIMEYHGRPHDNIIVNCSSDSTSATAFDSHTSGLREKFIGCYVKNSSGFGLRGRNHEVLDCTVVGGYNAVSVFDEGTGGQSYGHYINGLKVDDVTFILQDSTGTRSDNVGYLKKAIEPITINNVYGTYTYRPISGNYSIIYANNWNIQFTGSEGTGVLLTRSEFYMSNWIIDLSKYSGDGFGVLIYGYGPTTDPVIIGRTEVNNLKIINSSGKLRYIAGGAGNANQLRTRNVEADSQPIDGVTNTTYLATPTTHLSDIN